VVKSTPESGTEAASRVADELLAFASEPKSLGVSEIARRLVLTRPLAALTPNTITERLKLEVDLLRTEQLGTAVSFGERQPRAASVAAPVCGMDGHAIGAISACGPVDRFDEGMVESLRPLVRSAAREVSDKVRQT